MNISGRYLMRLLELDGWIRDRRANHGILFYKEFPGEKRPRFTVIPDKSTPLPDTMLGRILSVKQTGIGRTGLQRLIDLEREG